MKHTLLAVLFAALCVASTTQRKPNFVLFLTDDQDLMLGGGFPLPGEEGVTPMPKTKELLVENGITGTNFFIHTPICCPSRSELLTGRYFHNIKASPSRDASAACMHVNVSLVHNHTFAKKLQEVGYTVGLFGKYLNQMPGYVPEGFDAWFANGGGDYYNPEFVTRGVPGLKNGLFRTKNYSTSAIGNVSISWIKSVAGKKPFFAYIAPKAAHEPFNPAPWYENFWNDSWPMHEPRPPNYNCSHDSRKDHHGNIATQPMLTREAAEVVTAVFKNRWRTLMSVDDLVFEVLQTIKQLDLSDNTYVFYTSDHGFQLGQFNLLMDKRHVYDWNTRIPFVVTGPGIPKSKAFELPATQVDLAPTFLELAGVGVDLDVFDGLSLVSNLRKSIDEASPAFSSRSLTWKPEIQPRQKWRTSVFFEYYFNNDNTKCVHGCTSQKCASSPLKAPTHDRSCGVIATRKKCWCKPDGHNASSCYPTEDNSNNYIAIRTFGTNNQLLYAEFASGDQGKQDVDFDTTSFIEIYNVSNDPWMMKNLRNVIPVTTRIWLHRLLRDWYACKGNSCK